MVCHIKHLLVMQSFVRAFSQRFKNVKGSMAVHLRNSHVITKSGTSEDVGDYMLQNSLKINKLLGYY